MELNDYQTQAVATAIYGTGTKVMYPALGLAGECGEVCNKVKKIYRDKGGVFTQEDKEAIGKEVGDTLWYIAALLRDLDLTIEEVAQANLAKLHDRHKRGVIQGSGDNR